MKSAKDRLAAISEWMKTAAIDHHAAGMKAIEWHVRIQQLSSRTSEEECESMLRVLREHGLITEMDIPLV